MRYLPAPALFLAVALLTAVAVELVQAQAVPPPAGHPAQVQARAQVPAVPVQGDLPLPKPFAQPVKNAQERIAKLAANPDKPEALLAAGILRAMAGQFEEAARTLDDAAARLPEMAAWARIFAGYSRYRIAQYPAALADFDAVDPGQTALGQEGALLDAYCLEAMGSPEALARYRRFLGMGDHPLRAVALWRAAALASAAGQDEEAGRLLRELLVGLPWTLSAEKAEPLARQLASAGRIPFGPDEADILRERVEALLDKGMAAKALPLIERYAASPGAEQARSLYLKGRALYARRDTTGAVQLFEDAALTAQDPALAAWAVYHQARCLWRFSGPEDAARMEALLLDALSRAGGLADGGELAESCRRLLLLSRVERARFPEALAAATDMAANARENTEAREHAEWLAGLVRVAMGDHVSAAAALADFSEHHPNSDSAPAARYWESRAREALGDKAGAAQLLRTVLARWPNGYYGLLARNRLAALGEAAVAPSPAGACPDYASLAPPEAAQPALRRAAVLEAGQLPELAERELAALHAAMPKEPAVALRLAALSTGLNNHITAVRAVSRSFFGCLARGTAQELRPIREIVYPNRYPELIERNLDGSGVDPNLVRGLIRQESFFEPDAVSGAGAVGLMQMMPTTAKSQAEKYGEKGFAPETLKDPAVNIRFGVRYFLERYQEYGGNLALTLASYNAGRVKIAVWREFLGGLDQELFVEFIPYSETRDYVKRILGNQAMYAALY